MEWTTGIRFPVAVSTYLFATAFTTGPRLAYCSVQWIILPWEVKKLECETDNSFPHTADVTNVGQHHFWAYAYSAGRFRFRLRFRESAPVGAKIVLCLTVQVRIVVAVSGGSVHTVGVRRFTGMISSFLFRLSESESEPESACTIRVPWQPTARRLTAHRHNLVIYQQVDPPGYAGIPCAIYGGQR